MTKIVFCATFIFQCAVVTSMNEKAIRKPRNIKIDPEAVHRARVEALRSKKSLGEWLEEAIDEKIEREVKKIK